MQRLLLHICFLFFIPSAACAWPGRIVSVTDGDTITVEPTGGGHLVKVRLHGIDAPERKQHGGESAKNFLFTKGLYKEVDIVPQGGPDRYGRTVAIAYCPSGKSLQELLLENGLAWVWPRYCKNCGYWEAIQNDAKQAGRGIWSAENPLPPWEWRRK